MSLWRRVGRILADPLPQFLLIGAVLFAAATLWRREGGDTVIPLGPAEIDYQRRLYRLQFGAEPDAATLARLADQYVREEALFREARRLGLEAGDEIVRRRLVAKLEFLLRDSVVPPQATDAELEAWWSGHRDRFRSSPLASFEQRFFDAGGGEEPARRRAVAALAELRSQRAGAESLGPAADSFPPGERFERLDDRGVERVFGQSAFTEAVSSAPVDEWTGPFRSGYGWHLLRVTQRETLVAQDWTAFRDAVRTDWEQDFRDRRSAAAIDGLVARYRVRRSADSAGR